MSRPSHLLKGLALCALTSGVLLLLLEGVVLLVFGEQVRFPRHVVGAEFGVRTNQPYARYRHKSLDGTFWFRINGQGMRSDEEVAYAKPRGVRRIVSLGDSFTIGYEVDADETFSSVLERELRARGHSVQVLNAGVSGYSTAEAALYLERELLRYQPNVVLVSFYGNDLVDNMRTHLFRLEGDELVQNAERYVPGGRIGDFLNTNPVFNLLAERSNAFALFKERFTLLAKSGMVRENVEHLDRAESAEAGPRGDPYSRRLTAAIFERIYRLTRERGVALVIQSIPSIRREPDRLLELFPLQYFASERPGLWFFPARSVLEPLVGREPLYRKNSHGHWTPLAHALAGEALAELIDREGLLGGAPLPALAARSETNAR